MGYRLRPLQAQLYRVIHFGRGKNKSSLTMNCLIILIFVDYRQETLDSYLNVNRVADMR
jgi:hypothetical protein